MSKEHKLSLFELACSLPRRIPEDLCREIYTFVDPWRTQYRSVMEELKSAKYKLQRIYAPFQRVRGDHFDIEYHIQCWKRWRKRNPHAPHPRAMILGPDYLLFVENVT